jgi:hypothetical protein
VRFEAEARRIVRTLGLLDLHVDSLLATRLFGYDIRKRHSAGLHGQPIMWHCDLPRMREAGYRAATLGIHAWNFEYEGAWTECNRQFDLYEGLRSPPIGSRQARRTVLPLQRRAWRAPTCSTERSSASTRW